MRRGLGVAFRRLAQTEAGTNFGVNGVSGIGSIQCGPADTSNALSAPLDEGDCLMAVIMYLGPAVFLADGVAYAAPIVDSHAPIQFQPTVTQTGTGIPALKIAAPNEMVSV